jgi:hypothetical protein
VGRSDERVVLLVTDIGLPDRMIRNQIMDLLEGISSSSIRASWRFALELQAESSAGSFGVNTAYCVVAITPTAKVNGSGNPQLGWP